MWTTNSCVDGSYVAVVRRCCTSEPWPVSVIAKQPSSSPSMIGCRYFSWWWVVPSTWTAPPNRPHCTPALTSSDRSQNASIPNAVTTPPTSPANPRCGWPLAASLRRFASVSSRYSSTDSPGSAVMASAANRSRTSARTSANRPSSTFCSSVVFIVSPRG